MISKSPPSLPLFPTLSSLVLGLVILGGGHVEVTLYLPLLGVDFLPVVDFVFVFVKSRPVEGDVETGVRVYVEQKIKSN